MLTSYGGGYSPSAATRKQVVILPRLWKGNGSKRPVVWCHSAGGDATEPILPNNNTLAMLNELTETCGCPVISFDAGGGHWGNDDAQSDVDDAVAYLRNQWGASATLAPLLIGISMGGLLVFNYARANPTKVRALATFYPVVNLQWMHDNGAATGTETAYGGSLASFNAAVVAHDPFAHPAEYAALGVPMKMWYSTADAVVGSQNQIDFATNVGSALQATAVGPASHANMTQVNAGEFATFVRGVL